MVKTLGRQLLSEVERNAISGAIEAAEMTTSGEIYCVVAHKSGDYGWTTLIYGIILALLAPVIMLALGLNPLDLAEWLTRLTGAGWTAGIGASAADEAALGMAMVVAIQTAIVVLVSLLGLNADLREALTPGFVKRNNVHRSALEQFLAHGIHLTLGRTGVLIFVSISEHQAEIIADTAIYEKVDRKVWGDAIGALLAEARQDNLAAGMIKAVEMSGAVLAEHFPRQAGDENELPNRVVII
jgi:putative membrane protein